ncbi:MAG: glucosamine-6-phosphate deaminase [Halobacteriovoraceae bacterium]|nr:glucosamine-6-phosphate deaminase [Halobacteriovoraceae bacterium]|tara:strand:+ start:5344 stop:6174 length:831 start_codon:yes stop_codon:yes gene_type:complete
MDHVFWHGALIEEKYSDFKYIVLFPNFLHSDILGPMEIKIFDTAAKACEFTALEVLKTVQSVKNPSLGVATGRTMNAVYHFLVTHANKENISFADVKAFAVDEYVGLASDSPNSYREYLNLHLFNQLNFDPKNIFLPDVSHENEDEASKKYENEIRTVGGIDLQLLGIGTNGHIGFNEPGSAHDSETRLVALTYSTRQSNRSLFKNGEAPTTAISMGIGTIMSSKKCILVATGETKAEIVKKMMNAEVSSKIPATALRNHKNTILVLDKAAAKLIE